MQILNQQRIQNTIDRIAYQIAEDHYDSKKIFFVGMYENGCILSDAIVKILKEIINIETEVVVLTIDKKNSEKSDIKLSTDINNLKNQNIILVDDVIKSGRTLFYALKPFLNIKVKKLQTLILIERKYKEFPIHADFVGLSLNTTMRDHIEVKHNGKDLISVDLV